MSRLGEAFRASRAAGRAALIPYLTAGDPSLEVTVAAAVALAEAGAGIIELGVPFSDPVADGPVIQAASERALARGVRLEDVLAAAAAIRRQCSVGLLVFSYFNPVLQFGVERFAAAAAAAGCDGALITDLIPEEAGGYRAAMAAAGLDTVFLAAPTSPDARLEAIARASSGFIYAVARLGVTGSLSATGGAETLVGNLRRHTQLPVAVGFGLARAEQVRAVSQFADGAVVGSALVAAMAAAAAAGGDAAAAAGAFLRSLQ